MSSNQTKLTVMLREMAELSDAETRRAPVTWRERRRADIQQTDADRDRIAAAEAKRARKNAKRMKHA